MYGTPSNGSRYALCESQNRERERKGAESLFKEITAENFPN